MVRGACPQRIAATIENRSGRRRKGRSRARQGHPILRYRQTSPGLEDGHGKAAIQARTAHESQRGRDSDFANCAIRRMPDSTVCARQCLAEAFAYPRRPLRSCGGSLTSSSAAGAAARCRPECRPARRSALTTPSHRSRRPRSGRWSAARRALSWPARRSRR